jgi:hypothetical protein
MFGGVLFSADFGRELVQLSETEAVSRQASMFGSGLPEGSHEGAFSLETNNNTSLT